MSKISAIILTKNSEELIADCIDSVSFCDEIIVIDSNSSDRTPDLAKHMGARVFKSSSLSFSEKRNLGMEKAKCKWAIYIDDDERISTELKTSILKVASKNKTEFNAYKLKRRNFYFGNYEWPQTEEHVRFFDKKSFKKWTGQLHETPQFVGEASMLDGFLMHYTHRNIFDMLEKTAEWSGIEAELRFRANHPKMSSWRFFRVMITAFYNSFIKQKGYKAGTAGLVESIYQAFSMFITYARLWELQRKS